MKKSLVTKLDQLKQDPSAEVFIIADAKDADMAFGLAATGPPFNGKHPSLQSYRENIRAVVEQGIVDLVLMSASTNEHLALNDRIFEPTAVTPVARANDTTDIWSARHSRYAEQLSLPFRSTTLEHIQFGHAKRHEDFTGTRTDMGLYSLTFNNDAALDAQTSQAYHEFRLQAEDQQFRHLLEVFAPNALGAVPEESVGEYLNDMIVRTLAGVTEAGRPEFLKIPYTGAKNLEALVHYDPQMTVGILGGASGTTMDAFTLISKAQQHGARAALFGRKINHSEDQLLFIQYLRRIVDGEIAPADAVKAYHADLSAKGIDPARGLETDSQVTESILLSE
jgi:hypothetical protein